MRASLGLVNLGTDSSGATFYTAEEGDDTSGLYPAGQDSFGNAIYSDRPGASMPGSTPSWLTNILSVATGAYQQKQIVDINAQRLKQGLPPLPASQTSALAPSVNVGLSQQTQNLAMIFGAGVLLFLFLNKKR